MEISQVLLYLLTKKSAKIFFVMLPVFLVGRLAFFFFSEEKLASTSQINMKMSFDNYEATTSNGLNTNTKSGTRKTVWKEKTRISVTTTSPWYKTETTNKRKECVPKLVGDLIVNKSVPSWDEIDFFWNEKGWLEKGGRWSPEKTCNATKVAIIVPYRKRYEHLKIFLRHIHPILKRQLLDYRIFVVAQAGKSAFNRAMLFNIGYREALKFQNFTCFVFHDVDLIPENDGNYYGCPTSPRHLSVAIDIFKYELPYETILGGVVAFTRKHFDSVNGFSNNFWGWGGEDDDMYKRVAQKNLMITRPSIRGARYRMLTKYHRSAESNPRRHDKLLNSQQRLKVDGLNTLKYKLLHISEKKLYTKVVVDVKPLYYNYPQSAPS